MAQDGHAVVENQEHICNSHEIIRNGGQGQLLAALHAEFLAMVQVQERLEVSRCHQVLSCTRMEAGKKIVRYTPFLADPTNKGASFYP